MGEEIKERKWLSVVLIIVLTGSISGLIYNNYLLNQERKAQEPTSDVKKNYDVEKFNFTFKSESGVQVKVFVESMLDDVIESNSMHPEHQIEVEYKGILAKTSEEILKIRRMVDNSIAIRLNVSFSYDTEGYINKVTLEDEDVNSSNFNFRFNNEAGTKQVFFIKSILDAVIESNQKYEKHQIVVSALQKETTNADEIRNIKNRLGDNFKEYEVIFEYDQEGYINKMIIRNI